MFQLINVARRSALCAPVAISAIVALTSLSCSAGAPRMTTVSLLRAGRLAEACRTAFFGTDADRAAVAAELRQLAPLRARVHVLSGPDDSAWPPPAPPPLASGRLAILFVERPTGPHGASNVFASVSEPKLETLEERHIAHQTSSLLVGDVNEDLAYWMVTGSIRPGTGATPGWLLDGLVLTLSAGLLDSRLRTLPPSTVPPAPLPAPAAALYRRFSEQRPTGVCETAAGSGCTRPLALLSNPNGRDPERLVFEVSWQLGASDCQERRVVALPLPPGADTAARIEAVFAAGPIDLATAPTLNR